jgi:hypothetical protein
MGFLSNKKNLRYRASFLMNKSRYNITIATIVKLACEGIRCIGRNLSSRFQLQLQIKTFFCDIERDNR